MPPSSELNNTQKQGNNSALSQLSQERATESNAIKIPQISLPKGGGALKGIDEKFQVNASNGTASFSVSLPLSASRAGFQPSLQLSYNSGVGNSLFGIGWGVDIPSIQRRIDRKLPRYKDEEESDVFLFSGAEDLVPVLDANNKIKKADIGNFETVSYNPRIEGLFAKIERVNKKNDLDFFWKVTTKDNVVTFFGTDATNRIANPADKNKIFKWLPVLSFDDKGNCLVYEYKSENKDNIADTLHERNRLNNLSACTNKHLKKARYANRKPYYPLNVTDPTQFDAAYQIEIPPDDFMFEVVFDYGEHADHKPTESTRWKARKDAYSDYRAGFEIRSYRQCERVLMFHHFPELGDQPFLVRSMNFEYESSIGGTEQNAELIYLTKIIQTGFALNGFSKSLPAVTFSYQALKWNTVIKTISPDNIANAPVGIGSNYQWVDFYGEGISGILSEQADAWYYKSNLGNGEFTNGIPVSPKPSLMGISNGSLSLQDIDANGKKYIVSQSKSLQGYFEQTDENDWLPFKPFEQLANIDTSNPNVKMLDLNGDGMPDLVISEENVFTWYPSKGIAGYDSPELATKPFDDEKGPAIIFADSTQSIYLADMSGDGLTDIVRIENQRICYWPNLGYGRFGAKVTLSGFQGFDHPDLFNPSYIHLADVSGTGATDVVYLGKNKFKAYLNLSGNALSKPFEIDPFWDTAQPNQLSVIDLLGTGTACIVWSSPLPAYINAPMQYMDLMGGVKPHIMVTQHNGMGKETTVTYKSSTAYYLEDKKANKPWVTKLPFPVQCVSKVVVVDTVTDLRFSTQYAYHHGYYDHPEREFRGFGMVEQIDTEEYQYLKNNNAANATDIVFHEKPVLSKTWHHTGAFLAKEKILDHFKNDYWFNDPFFTGKQVDEITLPDAELPPGLTIEELREAHRCCKGMVLRQEVFSLDGTEKEKIPYSVATHNCHIRLLQPKNKNAHAVFLVHESEAVSYSYERNIDDPRVAHTFNLEIDEFGNVLKAASAVYGRNSLAATTATKELDASLQKHKDFINAAQTKEHIVYTDTQITTDAGESVNGKPLLYYRLPTPFAVKTFEVEGIKKSNAFFQLTDFKALVASNVSIKQYHENLNPVSGNIELRLIEEVETLLLSYDLVNPLPTGKHGALGMSFESYQLAFTPELVELLFNKDGLAANAKRVTDTELTTAKYLKKDNNWWIRSGETHFFDPLKGETRTTAQQRFYAPVAFTDPFNSTTRVEYDKTFLFVNKTIDELGNQTSVELFDYRVLAPLVMKDINDNLSAVSFDALGLVVGMAVMGKGSQADDLIDFNPDVSQAGINDFFRDPFANGKALLKNATVRTVYDFGITPARAGSIVRETHVRNEDGTLNPESVLQYSFEYTGGMGNSILKKVRAEAGKAQKVENGIVIEVDVNPRWVGNGRTILNNKGKPVKQYEPYFSTTHLYEDEPALQMMGVTPVLHYDAAGRQVR
ncbi:MAG: insecticidal toxin complex protein, partial [Ferruginibacter sp.]|nr:insecticidal toxin complex protein [Ferruginibacter sp.]